MKFFVQTSIVFVLLLSVFHSFIVSPAISADISPYLRKFKEIEITREQYGRLSKYNHLINYFCNFAYFKPRHKVSPDFIKALILAESNCNPLAVSHRDAYGLGQIILSTGKQAAKEVANLGYSFRYVSKSRLVNLTKEDLFDPAINILLTCYLISKYNNKFDGKLDLVVSAWNAGENVDSLKEGEPPPFSETRNLIGKINGYYIRILRQKRR